MIPDSYSLSAGVAWLFQPLDGPASKESIRIWWKERRIFYNIVVILTAVVSFLIYVALVFRSPRFLPLVDVVEPSTVLAFMIGGPIVWNLAYCLGPIIDIAVSAGKTKTVGPLLLKLALVVSLYLVSIPALDSCAVVFGFK